MSYHMSSCQSDLFSQHLRRLKQGQCLSLMENLTYGQLANDDQLNPSVRRMAARQKGLGWEGWEAVEACSCCPTSRWKKSGWEKRHHESLANCNRNETLLMCDWAWWIVCLVSFGPGKVFIIPRSSPMVVLSFGCVPSVNVISKLHRWLGLYYYCMLVIHVGLIEQGTTHHTPMMVVL